MQTYDFLMIAVLAAATLFGFWKGMAWQIASLASLVVSYFASLKFSAQLAPMFGQQAPLNRFVAMLAIYVGTSFIIWTLFRFISGAIDKVRLEAFDKQLGAMFGFAKGVLLCIAVTFFAVTILPQQQGEAIVSSHSGRYIVALLDKAESVMPPEVHQVVGPYLDRVEQKLRQGGQPNGQDLQQMWQNQVQANLPNVLPQMQWPQGQPTQPQVAWPSAPQQMPQQLPQQLGWPQSQPTARSGDPYTVPR